MFRTGAAVLQPQREPFARLSRAKRPAGKTPGIMSGSFTWPRSGRPATYMPTPGKSISVIAYIVVFIGLALLVTLMVRADLAGMLRVTVAAGLPLLWLLPYRGLFYLLYAIGWLRLVRPVDPEKRARLGYLWWATAV